MSLSSALSNAASGLAASARAVQVASSNVANALTEGYAPRRIDLVSASLAGSGTGVRVAGVDRDIDPILLAMLRDASSAASNAGTLEGFWRAIEDTVGAPGEGLSLALNRFSAALIGASERPDLDSRLASVAQAATGLADGFAAMQTGVQGLRAKADAAIDSDVRALNDGLVRLDAMNGQIVRLRASGQSTLGVQDERQALISRLSEIVPMREYPRADGRVTLFTTSGQLLLDLKPATIAFARSPAVDASMTLGNGLSGLAINGNSLSTGPQGPLSGGRLAANLVIRDVDGVAVQSRIDALAADLVARFEDPATDATRAPGQPGLFTDAGNALAAVPAAGLAGRLAVNTAVDPLSGGALWRLRDGLGAAVPGPVGASGPLKALLGALDRPLAAAPGQPQLRLADALSEVTTRLSLARQGAEDSALRATSRHGDLTGQMLAQGVDTDTEMQHLLAIEQAYAANARVIETTDAMLRRLMEI